MPTTITTSTASTATAYSNQRKIDRTSNGVLWAHYYESGTFYFRYSTDNGATWTSSSGFGTTGSSYIGNASFFIDQDDYAHFVFKQPVTADGRTAGFIYYMRGTPNAGRTAWTWSGAVSIVAATSRDHPDIVAFRNGTGWVAHIVLWNNGGSVVAYGVDITSAGTATVNNAYATTLGSGSTGISAFPSIDFNHTGDGKTVAGGTPHLYVAWSAGATGAGNGIRFKKATYSGGTWTWGTEREIDSTLAIHGAGAAHNWLNCLFDGTRVLIGGLLSDSGQYYDTVLHERDAADTTTTTRVLFDMSLSNPQPGADRVYYGSLSYDSDGNVYLLGRSDDGANGTRKIQYRKWTRATATLGSPVVIDSTGNDTPYVSAKRGYSNNRIEFIYTDGTASPYSVTFDSILLNAAPTATITNVANGNLVDPRFAVTVTYTYADAEGDAQQGVSIGYKKTSDSTWTDLTGTTTIPAGTLEEGFSYDLRVGVQDSVGGWGYAVVTVTASSWYTGPQATGAAASEVIDLDVSPWANVPAGAANYEVAVRTSDTASGYGPWSSAVETDPWIYGPEVTSGAETGTIDANSWTTDDYEIQVITADAQYWAPQYSESFVVPGTNVKTLRGGSFEPSPRYVLVGGVWVEHMPVRF